MKHGPVVHNVAEYYGLGHSVSFFQINNFRRMSACSVGQNWLGWSWARGEARIEMILVHCPLDRIKLYNLYGKNWIDYYRFDFHHGARAPGKVNVASPLTVGKYARGQSRRDSGCSSTYRQRWEIIDCKTDSDDQNFESLPGLGQSIPEGATFILT